MAEAVKNDGAEFDKAVRADRGAIWSLPPDQPVTAKWIGGLRKELLAEGVEGDVVNDILRIAAHEYFVRGAAVVLATTDEAVA